MILVSPPTSKYGWADPRKKIWDPGSLVSNKISKTPNLKTTILRRF